MKYKLSFALSLLLLSILTINAGAEQTLFQPYVRFSSVGRAEAVGVGDFNGDGWNDVAVTNSSSQLIIFRQDHTGSLVFPVTYDAGTRPESLAVGDFNHDGKKDIVVTNVITNTISVFLQQPNGTLASRVTFPTSTGPDALAVGDLNADGLDDIAVSHWNAGNIGIFTQNPNGTLSDMVTYPSPQAGYDDIAIGDINGDGRNDVVKMNGQGLNPNLSVYLQTAQGTLSPAQSHSISNCTDCLSNGVETGDVTGDGRTDIILSYGGNRPSSGLAVFAQAQDGSLLPAVNYPAYDIPEPVKVADVNSDGLLDVLTLHGGWNRVGVFLQEGGGLSPYTLYSIPYDSHYRPQGFDIGDINNDTLPDLAIAGYNSGLVVLYHTSPPVDSTPPTISVTAVKEDGSPYVAGTWTNQNVTVKFSCSDSESGIASCPFDGTFSTDGISSITGVAVDQSGNSASVDFGPIKIDKTAPALFISVSPNPVLLNGNAELVRNATDELSGIASNASPCLNIDTTTVGTKSVTCYAMDYAGNQTVATAQYQVIYDFAGFLSPVIDCTNNPCTPYNLSFFNVGSPVSLKFQLKDANGNLVQSANAPLWLVPLKIEGTPPLPFSEDYPFQTTGATYTWRKNVYQYDWSTKKYPARTTWLVGVRLDDGKTYYVFIYLK